MTEAADRRVVLCCLVRSDGKVAGYVRARVGDRLITFFDRDFRLTPKRTAGGWRIFEEISHASDAHPER